MKAYFEHLLHGFDTPLKNPVIVFSLILFIILLAPIILKKFNIPGLIGLILSGMLIGPHGLHILEKNSAVELFSTIGLLYIMFIAGLELDLVQFKANKNKSFLFGFFTFIVPLLIGYPVCKFILNYSDDASFLTASMFATHTLVAYPIVSRFGISKSKAVATTVGGTILTDTAVLIILAVVMGSHEGTLNSEFWIRLGISVLIFSFIMFFIVPRIARWFFQKLESENHAHYIFVLSVVFFAAFLSELAGLEPIIGAFVSGLALNKLIPHTSALMNRIEFIGNSLFIPFFLISVGMIVDTKVIFDGPDTLFVAAVLSITAISGKWIAAFLTQISFGFKSNERQLIFGLSSAHAAATLAVILVGYKAGILDEKILNGTIILILITCVVASFVTERASKRIVVDSSSDESFTPEIDPIENILIPVDSIDYLEKQIELSVLIKEKRSHNPITILNVVPNDDEAETNIAKGKSSVNEKIQLASLNKINVNLIARIDHNKTSGIIRTSKEIASNILILNWFVDGALMDKIFGEKMDMLLDQSDKMILVLKIDKPLVSVKRIVIAAPPLSELENGFKLWVKKITKLSEELSVPVILFSNEKTFKSLDKTLKSNNISIKVVHHEFNDWEDFLILSRDIYESDMFVLVSARKNSVSYISYLDTLPVKLDKHFNNNLIVVYPQQFNSSHSNEYENSNSEPLKKSIDVIEKVGKGIGSIFKK